MLAETYDWKAQAYVIRATLGNQAGLPFSGADARGERIVSLPFRLLRSTGRRRTNRYLLDGLLVRNRQITVRCLHNNIHWLIVASCHRSR